MKRRGSGRLGMSKYPHHFLKEWVLKTTEERLTPISGQAQKRCETKLASVWEESGGL